MGDPADGEGRHAVTGRERIVSAARGGETDFVPVVRALGASGSKADAIVVAAGEVAGLAGGDAAVLAHVLSPLGRAVRSGVPLVALLHEDVEKGGAVLERLTDEARSEMLTALANGADGVFYELDGAYPAVTTPMEYGGHFLEIDRKLLTEVEGARFNMLFVCGQEEPYIDFVCDLPAHAFAWDARSGVDAAYVRTVRDGALACEGGEFRLATNDHAGVRA